MGRTPAKQWCENCEAIRPCRSVNPSDYGEDSARRFYDEDHSDLRWFRRVRVCDVCGYDFRTIEIEEKHLEELTELREALADLKANAAIFESDIKKTGSTLKDLSKALKVLRALK